MEHVIVRTHVVELQVYGQLSVADSRALIERAEAHLGTLGYRPAAEGAVDGFSWSMSQVRIDGPFEVASITFQYPWQPILLESWESAVTEALAHAGAWGEVTARTKVMVCPAEMA